jgi:putative salt-induced outer membrane protein YdiY
MARVVWLLFSIALASAPARVAADEVRLADGSVVFGRVTNVSGGNLKIATDFAGELSIPLSKVAGLIVNEPRQIRVGATHEVQGTLGLDEGVQILIVDGRVQPLSLPHLSVLQDLGTPIVEPPDANWSGRAEAGLAGKSGNTDRIDARALVTATRTGPHGRLTLALRGAYAEVEGDRSQNELMGTELYERDLTDRLFAFEKLALEYDEFENLDLRATLSAGLGYFLIRSTRQELKVRGGLAYQYEEFSDGGSSTEDNFLLEAGYDYRLDLNRWFRFTSRLSFFVEPSDRDAWRFDAENAGEVPLSQTSGWKLKLGIRHEYDNAPQPGIEELDTSYYASLVYNWD